MADTMQFDLVSPERRLASAQVTEVLIPGSEGDMTVMASHAPTITILRPGLLKATGPDGTEEYMVTGGFAEINADGISVLAEQALPRADVTQETLDDWIQQAAEAHAKVREFNNEPGPVDDAVKLLNDMVATGTHIGLNPKQPNL
ncbi:F0F1 ATP synthase subunit epsilon [Oceaniglobus indicus]|uniref:F0F1 ATP synthase subunit epsilon n=1 Tax=Oceaniglobus indicus TaxID=2047749 RepID=UPI000C1A4DC8|nr:F0F1 ATP synthase subunit epsilon [Oceaniglobus indicus]